ncbi:MAG: IS66 family transposase [Alphaproteobacteria bacterium]|nr:IS66 family transposase [Alphaproteobacteria bacterium]
MDIRISELEAIIDRAQAEPLSEQEVATLQSAVKTLLFVTEELEKKRVSVKRLKQLLFGASTEKLKNVLEEALGQDDKDKEPQDSQSDTSGQDKPKGHGRNGADAYTGAEKVNISHDTLQPGDRCRACKQGSVYETATPGRLVRVTGQAPVHATVYELQKLRCNLCGKIFTAKPPQEVGEDKYDAESASMIALLKYGSGMPFNRLERLQGSLGVPLPAATQWDILTACLPALVPLHERLILTAAQGKVIHNDDTGMKVLELPALNKPGQGDSEEQRPSQRQGVFTSGIVSVDAGHRIALYFTGHRHAGENLAEVLKHRAAELAPPIQMCDALSRNMSEDFKAIVANCLAHGRRRFVEVAMNFPQECRYVLELLKDVYGNDAEAKQRGLSDEQRLAWHQAQSGPKMAKLKTWLTEQIEQHQVEPNSSLGEAITYMRTHWEPLTLFLRQPGAPLDNNICERALKKAILHRKNAYFYKTENGAHVGDLFMSLIHTCELNDINPFDYLTCVQKHAEAVALSPVDWMPWNYQGTLQSTDVS